MISVENINKILLFLTFALIYSSIVYLIGQKQETELELVISNSLLHDLIVPKSCTVDDGKTDVVCTQSDTLLWSNQSLNGTTHIKVKAPMNIIDFISYLKNGGNI